MGSGPDLSLTDDTKGIQEVVVKLQGKLLGGREEAQAQMQVDLQQEQEKSETVLLFWHG